MLVLAHKMNTYSKSLIKGKNNIFFKLKMNTYSKRRKI